MALKEGELAEYQDMLKDTIHEPVVPEYMDGAGSILSVKVAQAVLAADDIVGLRILQNDAAAVGLWLGALDIYYMNETEAGCSVRPWEPLQEGRIDWGRARDGDDVFEEQHAYGSGTPLQDCGECAGCV